ncbi:putative protease (plasmid) [Sinorhizobium fredii NGR234]|uniref:Protease n=1 Tax=Sinorhizobium fredii (strain NBRC 101917 / NGR234) TaxID=394 RepID=C3KQK6_SINFN|nr:S8 family serine peptidase [Sinorhizobium fredii]ACP22364.1 putative protease [Sinorhizobium fredii NGR234]
MGPLFRNAGLATYHAATLFVRMRPQPRQASFEATFAAARTPLSSGLQALCYYERAGLVKRVTPLSREAPHYASRMLVRPTRGAGAKPEVLGVPGSDVEGWSAPALNMNAAMDERTPGGATSLVELANDVDLRQLQLALAGDPTVASVSRVPLRYLVARSPRKSAGSSSRKPSPAGPGRIAAVPPPAHTMWNLRKIKWDEARRLTGFDDASRVKVAVLDTGIDAEHPDLKDQIGGFIYEHPDLPAASSAQDLVGHGTHVAGTVAATINNDLGINGISRGRIHAWKIFDDRPDLLTYPDGTAEFAYFVDPVMYLRALLDCADAGIDIINLSIGGAGAPDPTESAAFEELLANGTTIVAAMGNERREGSPVSYPAAIPGVIAVGATNLQDRITTFSNRGNHITIAAPGEAIWSTLPTYPGQTSWRAERGPDGRWRQGKPDIRETDYDAWPGTSMASPHVAAAAALYIANGGSRDPAVIRSALASSADKVPAMGGQDFTPDFGYGRLNLKQLIGGLRTGNSDDD